MSASAREVREEMATMRRELREEMAGMREELRAEIAESRRYASMTAESLRDDIRIIAEGVVSLSAKVDRVLPPQ